MVHGPQERRSTIGKEMAAEEVEDREPDELVKIEIDGLDQLLCWHKKVLTRCGYRIMATC